MGITACEAVARVRKRTDELKAIGAEKVTKEDLDKYIEDLLAIFEEADASLPLAFRR